MSKPSIKKIINFTDDLTDEVKKIQKTWKKWFFFAVSVFLFLFLIVIISIIIYQEAYKNKIYPGVSVGYFNIGGNTRQEADQFLSKITEKVSKEGLTFIIKTEDQEKQIVIPTISIPAEDPDLSREILSFDFNAILDIAWQYGRTGSYPNRFKEQFRLLLFGQKIDLAYELNTDILKNNLKNQLQGSENPGSDAKLKITHAKVAVIPEKPGNSFDYDSAITATIYSIESLVFNPIIKK